MKLTTYEALRENVYYDRLDNGLPVYVIKKRGFSKQFACIAVNYGGMDRRFKYKGEWIDTPAGVAHFLEHKMFDMPDGTNALATLSANGASPNAGTADTSTVYYFEGTDNFNENFTSLINIVTKPHFTVDSVAKEQGIIAQEIRMTEDNPSFALNYGLRKMLLNHHPSRDSVAGTVESIAEITDETLYKCHNVFYNPHNMCLAVSGDFDPDAVYDLARSVFPDMPGSQPQRDYGDDEPLIPSEKRGEKTMQVSLPIFNIGVATRIPPRGEERLRKAFIMSFAVAMLSGTSSPWFNKMYAQRLFLSFGAGGNSTDTILTPTFSGMAFDPEAVYSALMEEITRIAREGADKVLFERFRKPLIGSMLTSLDSLSNVATIVASSHFYGFDYFKVLSLTDTITVDDVTEFYREVLVPDRFAMFTVKPAGM